ncbi:Hsp20/alpha crystallin family protein [Pedobacter montanisoli]|uniref:Hsp20/alpha crystallin family protein n=1 Tax=Pedobacter montanisoli TaxID=2923277 RepID=A0ABS9ZYA2_9SPHI|nr:Hsp20/alpha crystallin family protein [Pedobacter montanisoli]MCJ0743265.1 Hsp20/alpha crystallin family protein [Pedobacter montanisoli]
MNLVKFNNRTRNNTPYFNNVFDSLFNEAFNKNYGMHKMPAVNIIEKENEYKIELAAPGLVKEDFKIDLKENDLTIQVEKKTEVNDEQQGYTRKEFGYTSFNRSFLLPDHVNQDKINAEYVNGVLTISIAKQDEPKLQHREIKIS